MKLFFSVFVVLFSSQLIQQAGGQTLTVSSGQLNFGNVYENAPDSLALTIQNPLNRQVDVTGFRFYNTYGSPAFSVSSNGFAISAGDSAVVWVKFSPRHNIFHNTEMVIENNSLRGGVSIDLRGQGKYSNTYYNQTENLSEENLKSAINTITGNGYISLLYNPARDTMFMIIDNQLVNGQGAAQNTLECIYTGRQAIGYTDRSDCQNNFLFNTEHTFPQSFFTSLEPMKSDLHHLFPSDNLANNQRADNPFGVVTSPSWSNGGSLSDGVLFEPRDSQKGKSARALLYFVLRYQNYNNFLTSQESVLRAWHQNFQPDAIEIKRNQDIFSVQNNRNPFVDYPVLLDRITSVSNLSSAPVIASIDLPDDTIVYGTVSPNIPAVYYFVIENNGNSAIHFTNFTLTQPTFFSFLNAGNDTVILPGEDLTLPISCNTMVTDSIRAFLSFNTDASGQGNVRIPIFVNDLVFTGINEIKFSANVFPNPAHDRITISLNRHSRDCAVSLYDLTGRLMLSEKLPGQNSYFDVSSLMKGMYILRVNTESGETNQIVIIN